MSSCSASIRAVALLAFVVALSVAQQTAASVFSSMPAKISDYAPSVDAPTAAAIRDSAEIGDLSSSSVSVHFRSTCGAGEVGKRLGVMVPCSRSARTHPSRTLLPTRKVGICNFGPHPRAGNVYNVFTEVPEVTKGRYACPLPTIMCVPECKKIGYKCRNCKVLPCACGSSIYEFRLVYRSPSTSFFADTQCVHH
jgi:hypothetical protein